MSVVCLCQFTLVGRDMELKNLGLVYSLGSLVLVGGWSPSECSVCQCPLHRFYVSLCLFMSDSTGFQVLQVQV